MVYLICRFLLLATMIFSQAEAFSVLDKHTSDLNSKAFQPYKKWILEKKKSDGKKALIESTILNTTIHYPITSKIKWAKSSMTNNQFFDLLDSGVSTDQFILPVSVSGNYEYEPNNVFWVDFANASTFGGGFRGNGNVQEERMFMEFPQLAQLAYVTRNNQILPVNNLGVGVVRGAEPFLIFSMQRRFNVSKVPYGRAIDNATPKEVKNDVVDLKSPYPLAHIIGLAAMDWSDIPLKQRKYQISDLQYLLKEALLGFLGAVQYQLSVKKQPNVEIHSGPWGCGAFKNSPHMITAIQTLAAAMAQSSSTGVELIFHGVNKGLLNEINRIVITNGLEKGKTPSALLRTFLDLQDNDSSWAPKS